MKPLNFLYLIIVALIIVVIAQRSTYIKTEVPKPIIDTVISIKYVHDTIPGKPVLIRSKKDTVWRDSISYIPDTSYTGLLKQYDSLGDKYFATHLYKTDYKLGTYGTASVLDTVHKNQVVGSSFIYNVTIPEKTVTIIKTAPAVKQIYLGGTLNGNPSIPIRSANLGVLYKDRNDRIFGTSVGWDGQLVYGFSMYWKIKLK
jgi:hypothetical protein